jgi:phage repressor protein C with HTH and peptisase S24 domain
MNMQQRIEKAIKDSGLRKAELARIVGVSTAAVTQWTSRDTKSLKGDTLMALALATKKNPQWLATGEGPEGAVPPTGPADTLAHRPNMIPVVGIVQGGVEGFWEEMGYPPGHGDGCVDWPSADPNAYAVECRGDSMQPRVRHGEIVVVEPGTAYAPGEDVIVISKDGRKMLKRFGYKRAGRIYLDSVNADHPQFSIDEAQVEAIHYVAGTVRPSRKRDASDDQCRAAIEQHRQRQERHARRRQVDGFLASLPNNNDTR